MQKPYFLNITKMLLGVSLFIHSNFVISANNIKQSSDEFSIGANSSLDFNLLNNFKPASVGGDVYFEYDHYFQGNDKFHNGIYAKIGSGYRFDFSNHNHLAKGFIGLGFLSKISGNFKFKAGILTGLEYYSEDREFDINLKFDHSSFNEFLKDAQLYIESSEPHMGNQARLKWFNEAQKVYDKFQKCIDDQKSDYKQCMTNHRDKFFRDVAKKVVQAKQAREAYLKGKYSDKILEDGGIYYQSFHKSIQYDVDSLYDKYHNNYGSDPQLKVFIEELEATKEQYIKPLNSSIDLFEYYNDGIHALYVAQLRNIFDIFNTKNTISSKEILNKLQNDIKSSNNIFETSINKLRKNNEDNLNKINKVSKQKGNSAKQAFNDFISKAHAQVSIYNEYNEYVKNSLTDNLYVSLGLELSGSYQIEDNLDITFGLTGSFARNLDSLKSDLKLNNQFVDIYDDINALYPNKGRLEANIGIQYHFI